MKILLDLVHLFLGEVFYFVAFSVENILGDLCDILSIRRFDEHAVAVLLALSPPALIAPLHLTVAPSEYAESMFLVVAILSFIGFAISECELPETMHHILKKLSSITAAVSPDLSSNALNLVASPLPNED